MNNTEYLKKILSELNIELTEHQTEDLNKFYNLLTETNKVMNLTAITDYKEAVIKHFADSLSLNKIYNLSDTKEIRIIDIGTGAGFPGIPLKIVYPHIDITLLDSLGKRITFIEHIIEQLDLNKEGYISAVNMRAEDYVKETDIRESYDLAVSRAVANMSVLCEYALPYVKTGGSFISYKSGDAEEELMEAAKAIDILGGEIGKKTIFTLPDSDIARTFIEIKKTRSTPGKFPRKAGLPNKKPLK